MDFHRIKNVLNSEHTLSPDEWKGAVLFLCNEKYVFLIKRSEDMPTHSGQIAFVGGHKKTSELTPWDVAQREFEEETQHSRDCLELMGYLSPVMPARMQPIVPVVARLKLGHEEFLNVIKSNGEWDEVIAYPWSNLINEESWEYAWRNGFTKSPVMFHTIGQGTFLPESNNGKSHMLWGATASMIWDFLRLYFRSP